MKQNGIAFRVWALDNHDRFPMGVSVTNGGTMELGASGVVFPHFQVMSNELSTPKLLICPEDKQRTSATNFESGLNDTKLSYFVGLDSVPENASTILSGDRNLTNHPAPDSRLLVLRAQTELGWTKDMHSRKGNLLFGDGSVSQFSNGQIGRTIQLLGSGTNRLAVP